MSRVLKVEGKSGVDRIHLESGEFFEVPGRDGKTRMESQRRATRHVLDGASVGRRVRLGSGDQERGGETSLQVEYECSLLGEEEDFALLSAGGFLVRLKKGNLRLEDTTKASILATFL